MTFGWVAAGSAVAGALISSSASKKAAQTQADAANRASDLQYQQYQEDVARQKPFYDVGVNALPELVEASKYTPFGMDQYKQDPGYGFRLAEGQKALDRMAAARGKGFSGESLRAAERYGQEMGSQEYMNAFNRYQTERAARLNPLQSLTGMGQTTANTLGTMGSNMATNVGQNYQSAANARASGYVGAANSATSGLGTYLNYTGNQNLINSLRGGGVGGTQNAAPVYEAGQTYTPFVPG